MALVMSTGTLEAAGMTEYGVNVENTLETGNGYFKNTFTAAPYLNLFFNKTDRLFLSVEFLNLNDSGGWTITARPGISGFSMKPVDTLTIEAGRLRWKDQSGIIADGIFDGIAAVFAGENARLTARAYYTGLVTKDQTAITMSADDISLYQDAGNNYAPKKALSGIEADVMNIFGYNSVLSAGIIAQFDLAKNNRLHNQYFSAKTTFTPLNGIIFTMGMVNGLAWQDENYRLQGAAFGNIDWYPEWTSISSRLSLGFMWASGPGDTEFGRFFPVTRIEAGKIFPAMFTNLALCKLSYTINGISMTSILFETSVFFRTSSLEVPLLETKNETDTMILGEEIYAGVSWKLQSIFSFDAGFGVFLLNEELYHDYSSSILWKFKITLTAAGALPVTKKS